MKIIEIENSRIAKMMKASITLYPFILYDGVPSEKVRKHEFVHIAQIEKLGFFYFYASYLAYYFKFRLRGMDGYRAYRAIPYEIEAYTKENE